MARPPGIRLLFLVLAAALYTFSLPLFLQGGDTSELVTAAYARLVAHPPGYPLWVWLQNAWIHLSTWQTPFWRAALLNTTFSLTTLFLLTQSRQGLWAATVIGTLLMLSPAFSEAAILPDVFALHGLFTALILWLYLSFDPASRARQIALPLVFAIATAHHHTIVLLLPLVAAALWESLKAPSGIKRVGTALFAGLAVSALFYFSLFYLNPESPHSWGRLVDFKSLVHHVLRVDYGTFSFSAGSQGLAPSSFWNLLSVSLLSFLAPLFFFLFLVLRDKAPVDRRTYWLGISTLLSSAFLLLCTVPAHAIGAEVLLRFHLMPTVIVAFFTVHLAKGIEFNRQRLILFLVFALPGGLLFAPWSAQLPKLRHDSVIEDYARNLLREASVQGPSVILTEGDHVLFSLRYLQVVEGIGTPVGLASGAMSLFPWYFEKLKIQVPELQIPAIEEILKTKKLHIPSQLLTPNADRVGFFAARPFTDPRDTRITYQATGHRLAAGQGVDFDAASLAALKLRTRYLDVPRGPQAYTRGDVFAIYSQYYLMRGEWKNALEVVPYAAPAFDRLCQVEKASICFFSEAIKRAERGRKFF